MDGVIPYSCQSIDDDDIQAVVGIEGEEVSYTFRDENPFDGDNYYRVWYLDEEGQIENSITKEVRHLPEDLGRVHTFPNPVRGQLTVEVLAPEQTFTSLEIYDLNANLIAQQDLSHEVETAYFDTSSLEPGMYLLMARSDNGKTISQRFIVSD